MSKNENVDFAISSGFSVYGWYLKNSDNCSAVCLDCRER